MSQDVCEWLQSPLTPRERVARALRGEPVDRPAAVNPTSLFNVDIMARVDAWMPEVHRDPEKMTRLAETSHTIVGLDTVKPVFCTLHEVAALGADVRWGDRTTVPSCAPIVQHPSEIRIPHDWMQRETITVVLESLRELKRRHGDTVFVLGLVDGPWTQCYHFFGTQNFLMMGVEDPAAVRTALATLKEVTVEFGQAQLAEGVDGLLLNDHATGDLVSAEWYRDFLFEIHCEFTQRLDCPIILHICGRTVDRMPYIGQTGLTAYHFESRNRPDEAVAAIGPNTRLTGNINNPTTILAGTPEQVYAEAVHVMNHGIRLVSAECFGPLFAATENLRAIGRAARDYPSLSTEQRTAWGARANKFGPQGDLLHTANPAVGGTGSAKPAREGR